MPQGNLMAKAVCALVVVAVVATANAAQSRGAIAGVVLEIMGGSLPGTTITATSGEARRSVVVGTDGQFRNRWSPAGHISGESGAVWISHSGPQKAKAAIEGKGNYTWIYSTIFRDEARIAAVVDRHGLRLK
jgi:hypothetical protein